MSRTMIEGQWIDAQGQGWGGVAVEDGRITDLLPARDGNPHWLLPAPVDLAWHPGALEGQGADTLRAELTAAIRCGVADVAVEPDTRPVLDDPAAVALLPRGAGMARAHPIGALSEQLEGQALSRMASLKEAGVRCVGMALAPVRDSNVLRRALQYARSMDLTVMLHPQDASLTHGGVAHAGKVATRLGLKGIPVAAETAGLARDLALVADTGCRVHFCRISSARAVEMIAQAKADGLPITADAAIAHLFLTDHDLMGFNPNLHLRPPLRDQSDRDALRQGLADGTLDAIVSQHTPLGRGAKTAPFPMSTPGAATLDAWLPLCAKLVQEGILTQARLHALIAENPARILGLEPRGLKPGQQADCLLFDPRAEWLHEPEHCHSHAGNPAFHQWPMTGRVRQLWLAGQAVL